MNKNGLIKKVSNICSVCEKDVHEIVSTTFDVLSNEIFNGESVTIMNFGKFFSVNRKERKGKNPKTQEDILIPEKKAIRFITCHKVKSELNN